MEERLLKRNKQHFQLAQGTPFTEDPLRTELPFSGSSKLARQILDGRQIPEELKMSVNTRMMQKAKRKTHEIKVEFTVDEVKKGFQRWRETTSTSPSGRHLGHYKSILKRDGTGKEEHEESVDEIFGTQTALMSIAFKHGLSYNRWQNVNTILIEKDPGQPYLHRMRTINIYESDLNLGIKIIWARRMMWNAEAKNLFADGQWGGRKGKSAIEAVIEKQLMYDYSHRTLVESMHNENDASNCYDREIPSHIMLMSRAFGVSENACKAFGETLEKAQYHVSTKAGISSGSYSNAEAPVYGLGQGNAGAGPGWGMVSSELFKIMKGEHRGAIFTHPSSKKSEEQLMTGYVDDTSINISKSENELRDEMQKAIQKWEELLFATGGKLEISKCFYYHMKWEVDEDDIPRLVGTSLTKIELNQSKDKKRIQIEPLHEASRVLGVMCAPDLSCDAQALAVKNRSNSIAKRVQAASFSIHMVELAYRTTYIPSISYSLPATFMTRSTCDKIQAPATRIFLAMKGFNPNFPRIVA